VTIVGRRPDRRDVPACAAWHPDVHPGLGPLGGIATALQVAAATGRPCGVCAVACDMAALGGDMLDFLLAGRDRRAPATVPVHPTTGRMEPLLAIYESTARQSVSEAMDSGTRSVTQWLQSVDAHRLTVPDDLAAELTDVDTPADLDALRRRGEGGGA
jgi:molybdopterin-guanine dinucleotide biosynthesis protein A